MSEQQNHPRLLETFYQVLREKYLIAYTLIGEIWEVEENRHQAWGRLNHLTAMLWITILRHIGLIDEKKLPQDERTLEIQIEQKEDSTVKYKGGAIEFVRAMHKSKEFIREEKQESTIVNTLTENSSEFKKLNDDDQLYLACVISKIPQALVAVCIHLAELYRHGEKSIQVDSSTLINDIRTFCAASLVKNRFLPIASSDSDYERQ